MRQKKPQWSLFRKDFFFPFVFLFFARSAMSSLRTTLTPERFCLPLPGRTGSPSLTFPWSRPVTLKVCTLDSAGAVSAPSFPRKVSVFPNASCIQPAIICLTQRDTQSPEVCDGDSGHCIAFPNGSQLQKTGYWHNFLSLSWLLLVRVNMPLWKL